MLLTADEDAASAVASKLALAWPAEGGAIGHGSLVRVSRRLCDQGVGMLYSDGVLVPFTVKPHGELGVFFKQTAVPGAEPGVGAPSGGTTQPARCKRWDPEELGRAVRDLGAFIEARDHLLALGQLWAETDTLLAAERIAAV